MSDQGVEQPSQLSRIEATLNTIDTKLGSLTSELRRVDGRTTAAKRAAVIGVIVGAVGVSIGIGALTYGLDARATARDIVDARSEARVTACKNDNVRADGQRKAFHLSILTLVPLGPLTPDQQKALDRYDAAVAVAVPFRDCSPQAIEAYYQAPPADPALNPTTTTAG